MSAGTVTRGSTSALTNTTACQQPAASLRSDTDLSRTRSPSPARFLCLPGRALCSRCSVPGMRKNRIFGPKMAQDKLISPRDRAMGCHWVYLKLLSACRAALLVVLAPCTEVPAVPSPTSPSLLIFMQQLRGTTGSLFFIEAKTRSLHEI